MAVKLPMDRRFDAEFVTVIANALLLSGVPGNRPYKGTLAELLDVAAVTDDDRALLDIAWRLVARRHVQIADDDEQQLQAQVAALLSSVAAKLLDAMPLSMIARLSVPRVFSETETVEDALAYLSENSFSFIAYEPSRGSAGLISYADFAVWLADEVARNPYDAPVRSMAELAHVYDRATRSWRTVTLQMTVGDVRTCFERIDRHVEAVLVCESGGRHPRAIVTPTDLKLWERPSRSRREQAKAAVSLWLARMARSERPEVSATERTLLCALPAGTGRPLTNAPDECSRLAEAILSMLEPLGFVGIQPQSLYRALCGQADAQAKSLGLDAAPAFGRGVGLASTYVGDVLQRLYDEGLVQRAPDGSIRRSPRWDASADLSWLDATTAEERDFPEQTDGAIAEHPSLVDSTSIDAGEPESGSEALSEPEATPDPPNLAPAPEKRSEEPKAVPAARVAPEPARQEPARKRTAPLVPLPYKAYEGKRETGNFFKAANILSATLSVIRAEGPIAGSLLMKRVAGFWGIQKVTAKVRERFKEVLPQTGARAGIIASSFGEETFYMTSDQRSKPSVRTNAGTTSGRASSEIPLEEIRVVIEDALSAGPVPRAKLIVTICEAFGLDTGKAAPKKMAGLAIDVLVERGRLEASGKLVSWK